MCNSAYLHSDYPPSLIAENSCFNDRDLEPGRLNWTESEIAAIRSALKKLTSMRILNPNDVEDLVQDTLLTMLIKTPGLALEKGPMAWSLGILRKKVGNYYRRTQRQVSLEELSVPDLPGLPAASPEGMAMHAELAALIRDVLSEIPSSQRQALEMLISGHTAREITEALHPVTYQNVINRLHRGRRKLVSVLSRYGYGPDTSAGMRSMKRTGSRNRSGGRKASRTA